MASKRPLKIHIAAQARRDIAAILKRSEQEFGFEASLRYEALIRQALIDIETHHERPGSKERPELMVEGARTYQISLSRRRVSGAKVAPHFLLYRRRDDFIEVARILHGSRDLEKHLPSGYGFVGSQGVFIGFHRC